MNKFNEVKDEIKIVWNGRVCYIAMQVAEIFNHDEPSKAVNRAIKLQDFIIGYDYDILSKEELKKFKNLILNQKTYEIRYAPKIIILYETGLDKFVDYLDRVLDNNILSEKDNFNKNIDDIFIKTFGGEKVYTFMWNGRPCWIATQIADLLDYQNKSKAVLQCIEAEKFDVGYEYEVLVGDNLKFLKKLLTAAGSSFLKQVPKVIIFYEDGLYGFLQYSEKPIGVEFRKWLRREVLPEIRRTGSYSINGKEKAEEEDFKEKRTYPNSEDNLVNLNNQDRVLEIISLINNIVENNKDNKISDLKEILYIR